MNDRREDGTAGLRDSGRTTGSSRGVGQRARFLILVGAAVACLALVALLVV